MTSTPQTSGAWRRAAAAVTIAAVAAALAACSSGSSSPSRTSRTSTTTAGPSATTTSPKPPNSAETAVLNAWESAEQTLYGYLQRPWQQDRADLVAGETSATLWPKLADYFVNPALQAESTFLVGVKMAQLNGPTTYNLGHPAVSALTNATATVTGCIYDTGTTTDSGQPGPSTLGGGAGYASGTWQLLLVDNTWKVSNLHTTTVPKC